MTQKQCPHCKGTGLVGDARLRLSEEQVLQAREMVAAGAMQKDVAAMFGVTVSTISRVVNGKSRKPVRATDA